MHIFGLFFVFFVSACNINTVGFGGCDGSFCYEISHLPKNWQSSNLFSPNGNFEQTFSGSEGRIHIAAIKPITETSIQDLTQEYINQIPDNITYSQESMETDQGNVIFVQLEGTNKSGEVCFSVLSNVDGQFIIAKAYSDNGDRKQLCEIFRKAILSYKIYPNS